MGGFVPLFPGDDQESDSLIPKVKDSGDQDRNFGVNFADLDLSEDFPDFSAVEEWFDNLPPGSLEFWSSMGEDCELGLAGSGVSVKVEESEGENVGALCSGGGVLVKVVESGGEKIGALCGGGGVSVKVEECEVGEVGVIGGEVGGRGEGMNDVEAFVEREMGRVSLGCGNGELGGGGGGGADEIGGGGAMGQVIFGTGQGASRVVGGAGVSVKAELDGGNGLVCDGAAVVGGDGVCVKTELAGEMADDSLFVGGGGVVESNEKVDDGKNELACEDVRDEDPKEAESRSSSDESSLSSSTSDDNSDEEDEDDDKVDGTEEKHGGVKADEEMDEMEEGEIREADELVMPAEKEIAGGDADDEDGEDADKMVDWSDVENETDDESEVMTGPIMSKNELKVLPPVPSVSVKLEPHHEMIPIGPVLSIVELQVVVEGCKMHNPLNEGSILWITESRSPLGFIDEIFGPVKNPYYLIRYNSKAEIPAGVKEGALVSSVPQYASYVLNQKDLYKRGYDLSGKNDEEILEDEEFSDDEKEAEYKRMQRMAKRDTEMNKQKHVNRKVQKKKDNGRNPNWKPRPSTQQMPTRVQLKGNQDHPSTRPASTGNVNSASSSAMQPGFFGGKNDVPPFPLQMPNGGNSILPFNPSLLSGLPLQGPTGVVLINAISNAMLSPANNGQFPAQTAQFPVQTAQFPAQPMVPPNQVPFQLGFDPSQNILTNLVSPGLQSNPFGDPASSPWSGPFPRNSFNPAGVGMSPGGQLDPNNNLLLFANALGIHLSGGQSDPNFNAMVPPPAAATAAVAMPPPMQGFGQFNPGVSSGPRNRPFRRGGGRFSGGRGRGRSN